MSHVAGWRSRVGRLKTETYALYLAYRDPRVSWWARLFVALVVAYAFSPIDLIPDFIPIAGYLDDLVLLPLGIYAATRMIPAPVLDECRASAQAILATGKPVNRAAAAVIIGIWILLAAFSMVVLVRLFGPRRIR